MISYNVQSTWTVNAVSGWNWILTERENQDERTEARSHCMEKWRRQCNVRRKTNKQHQRTTYHLLFVQYSDGKTTERVSRNNTKKIIQPSSRRQTFHIHHDITSSQNAATTASVHTLTRTSGVAAATEVEGRSIIKNRGLSMLLLLTPPMLFNHTKLGAWPRDFLSLGGGVQSVSLCPLRTNAMRIITNKQQRRMDENHHGRRNQQHAAVVVFLREDNYLQ